MLVFDDKILIYDLNYRKMLVGIHCIIFLIGYSIVLQCCCIWKTLCIERSVNPLGYLLFIASARSFWIHFIPFCTNTRCLLCLLCHVSSFSFFLILVLFNLKNNSLFHILLFDNFIANNYKTSWIFYSNSYRYFFFDILKKNKG